MAKEKKGQAGTGPGTQGPASGEPIALRWVWDHTYVSQAPAATRPHFPLPAPLPLPAPASARGGPAPRVTQLSPAPAR